MSSEITNEPCTCDGAVAKPKPAEAPPCQCKVGLRKVGWVNYAGIATKLRRLGIKAKPWVLVGYGLVGVCCKNHDPNSFDDGRKFRILDEVALISYDAEIRMGLGVKR